MKTKPISLQIPMPCHESWQQMDAAHDSRFCHSCKKTVLDFTEKTDRELALFFQQPPANTCGRFRPDQIERPLRAHPLPKPTSTWLKGLALVLPGLLAGGNALAQTDRPQIMGMVAVSSQQNCNATTPAAPPPLQPIPRKLRGQVTDAETGEPLIFCTIVQKGTMNGTESDFDGNFQLSLLPDAPPVLVVEYTGYTPAEVLVEDQQAKVSISLSGSTMLMGAVVIYRREDETLYQKVREMFRKMRHRHRPQKTTETDASTETVVLPIAPALPQPEPAAAPVLVAKAYPNPFSQHLQLELDCPTAERLSIHLNDLSGRRLFTQLYEALPGSQTIQIDLSPLAIPAGPLLLEVVEGKILRLAQVVEKS